MKKTSAVEKRRDTASLGEADRRAPGEQGAGIQDGREGEQRISLVPRKRSFMEKVEAYVTKLSTRSNFWHRVCAWIWLPAAYHSGIKMLKEDQTFSAVLPFRRFNKNWYKAMAGAALLGNSEIAGGMYVFNQCDGEYGVVCKELHYRFLRPCVGPAIYRITPREEVKDLASNHKEFNVTLDMEILQMMRTPQERERLVGRCRATFHATAITGRRGKERRRKNRDRARSGR